MKKFVLVCFVCIVLFGCARATEPETISEPTELERVLIDITKTSDFESTEVVNAVNRVLADQEVPEPYEMFQGKCEFSDGEIKFDVIDKNQVLLHVTVSKVEDEVVATYCRDVPEEWKVEITEYLHLMVGPEVSIDIDSTYVDYVYVYARDEVYRYKEGEIELVEVEG